MAKNNPYELAARRGRAASALPGRPVRAGALTETERAKKLVGYVLVSPEFWPNVKHATHVRYTKKGSEDFLGGGFVVNNPFDTKVQGTETEKRFLKLQNDFNKGGGAHAEWIVAYEDVDSLYAKGTGVELTLQKKALTFQREVHKAVAALDNNVRILAERYKKLDRRLKGANP